MRSPWVREVFKDAIDAPSRTVRKKWGKRLIPPLYQRVLFTEFVCGKVRLVCDRLVAQSRIFPAFDLLLFPFDWLSCSYSRPKYEASWHVRSGTKPDTFEHR